VGQIIRSGYGALFFGKPGIYIIELKARKLNFEKGFGPKIYRVKCAFAVGFSSAFFSRRC
jgi:hypothetical protein